MSEDYTDYTHEGDSWWFSDMACPDCDGRVATNGKVRRCWDCDWWEKVHE